MNEFRLVIISVLLTAVCAGCGQRPTVIRTKPKESARPAMAHQEPEKSRISMSRAHLSNGLSLYRGGEYNRARQFFERSVAADYGNWQAHYYLGLASAKSGRLTAAVVCLHSSLKHAPDNKRTRSRIYLALGETWEQQGQLAKAEINYITAINLYPSGAAAQEGLRRVNGPANSGSE